MSEIFPAFVFSAGRQVLPPPIQGSPWSLEVSVFPSIPLSLWRHVAALFFSPPLFRIHFPPKLSSTPLSIRGDLALFETNLSPPSNNHPIEVPDAVVWFFAESHKPAPPARVSTSFLRLRERIWSFLGLPSLIGKGLSKTSNYLFGSEESLPHSSPREGQFWDSFRHKV